MDSTMMALAAITKKFISLPIKFFYYPEQYCTPSLNADIVSLYKTHFISCCVLVQGYVI